MPSSARFATFARVQVRPALALLVPAAAALTLVLATTEPATAGAPVVAAATDGVPAPTTATTTTAATAATAPTAQTNDSDNGFSWG
ncbi:hypothetical protein ACFT0G_17040 [Streptomyces sp. NPDC057020]|uniref:hypothetical protein n=1 Tax=unclassified Streptomyces TaxID=2593676 RepID=UPI0036285E25